MPIKVTEVSVRSSTDIDFPNVRKVGGDPRESGHRNCPGFISKTISQSDDGLTKTEISLWEDDADPFAPKDNADSNVRISFDSYCEEHGITVISTVERI